MPSFSVYTDDSLMHAPFFLIKKWQVLILNSHIDIDIDTGIVVNLSF